MTDAPKISLDEQIKDARAFVGAALSSGRTTVEFLDAIGCHYTAEVVRCAIAAEREACAKVLERRAEDVADTGSVMAVMALRAGAALIRARKDET